MRQLCASSLPLHITYLLIEFLGQVKDPSDQEAVWLFLWLDNSEYRAKVLSAVGGNPGWFARMKDAHLPALMELPENEAWPVVLVLSDAWPFAKDVCLQLLL